MEIKLSAKTILYLVISLIPFLYAVNCYFMLDIWNDEMYTLRYFTFTHWSTTLTDYHVPNNHIFYNVLNKITLSIAGISTLESAIQYHWVLRILPLAMGIVTLGLVFKIADYSINRNAAWLSVAFLIASLPWLNHFLQIRGYGLSTMLFTTSIYLVLKAIENNSTKTLGLLILSTGLLLYTIPLNMYYILSIILCTGSFAVIRIIYIVRPFQLNKIVPELIQSAPFRIAFAIGLGVLLGLALYGPVIQVIFNNDTLKTKEISPAEFIPLLKLLSSAFLNKRYFILPLSLAGLGLILFKARTRVGQQEITLLFFICLFLFPLFIADLRGDPAPDRSFIMLTPVFALILGSAASLCLEFLKEKYISYAMIVLLIYNSAIGMREMQLMQNMLYQDIIHNNRTQNISRAYYLDHFQSHQGVRIFDGIFRKKPAPLIIYAADHHGIRGYLDTYQIPWLDDNIIDSVYDSGNDFYLLHTAPLHITKELSGKYPKLKCIELLPEFDFHNYCFCQKSNQ